MWLPAFVEIYHLCALATCGMWNEALFLLYLQLNWFSDKINFFPSFVWMGGFIQFYLCIFIMRNYDFLAKLSIAC